MLRVAVNACTGKMGQEILFAVDRAPNAQLVAPLLRKGHKWVGEQVSSQLPIIRTHVAMTDDLSDVQELVDVLIDFSLPEHSIETAKKCAEMKIPMVVGTTGFSYQQKQAYSDVATKIPVLMAPNMSVGVNLLLKVIEMVAHTIGEEADIEIMEKHHRFKKDSPSGTALRMGESVASGLGKVLSQIAAFDRCGKDAVRKPGSVGFSAIRAGNIVGEHTALFALAGEEIELTHKAQDRQTFAQGALKAASWITTQKPGLYDMMDMLNLK